MPELPEAQRAAEILAQTLRGTVLRSVEVRRPNMVRQPIDAFVAALVGQTLERAGRVGKHVFAVFGPVANDDVRSWSGPSLAIHLGMSGKLQPLAADDPAEGARIVWRAEDAALALWDTRTLGRVAAGDADEVRALCRFSELGVDALEVRSGEALAAALGSGRAAIKTRLMNQKKLAGLGNIQACEALFRAGIDPEKRTLSNEEYARLADAIAKSIAHTLHTTRPNDEGTISYMSDGSHIANPFLVYGREGAPCPNCAQRIVRFNQAGRSTFACRACQR